MTRYAPLDPADPITAPHDGTTHFLVHAKRPDGSLFLLRVENEHFDRVNALTQGEFRDTSIKAIGPEPKKKR